MVYPVVFLSVAAFMVNSVLARLVRLQREQIAQLKALGYSSWQVGRHYLSFAMVIVLVGSTLGGIGGRFMGGGLITMYELFFRFPELRFIMDWSAVGIALVVSAGASFLGVLSVVWMAVKLPPAEAMRPEPPTDFKPSLLERVGLTRWFTPTFRMALRNIERRPWQSVFTMAGLALATGLMVLPGSMQDSIDHLLTYQWNDVQRQDAIAFLIEPSSGGALHDLEHLPGVTYAEPIRSVQARIRFGHHVRKLAITGLPKNSRLNRLLDIQGHRIDLPEEGLIMSDKLAKVLGAKLGEEVQVSVLEGQRPQLNLAIRGLMQDFTGVSAYMDLDARRRLMREGPLSRQYGGSLWRGCLRTGARGAWRYRPLRAFARYMRRSGLGAGPRAASRRGSGASWPWWRCRSHRPISQLFADHLPLAAPQLRRWRGCT
jgi:putative ABC transport system permease protein